MTRDDAAAVEASNAPGRTAPSQRTSGQAAALALVLVCIAVVLAAVAGVPVGPLELPAGLVVALFAPGYAILLVAWPRPLSPLATVLSVPLSLSVAVVLGVVLDLTPSGSRPLPLALGLSAATLTLLAVALWRHKLDLSVRGDLSGAAALLRRRPLPLAAGATANGEGAGARRAPNRLQLVVHLGLVMALALALASWIVVFRRAADSPGVPFVALHAVADTTFVFSDRSARLEVRIGVDNARDERVERHLDVDLVQVDGERLPQLDRQLALAPGESREIVLRLEAPCEATVEARLTPSGGSDSARTVRVRPDC